MPRATVTFDVYNWQTPIPGRPGDFQFNTASRGDVIDVSDEEVERGRNLGALLAEDEDAVPASGVGPPPSAAPAEETAVVAGFLPATPTGAAPSLADFVKQAGVPLNVDDRPAPDGPTAAGDATFTPATDAELAAMNAEPLVAYLNQHNDELDRVEAIESRRSTPRQSVTAAITRIREEQAAQAAAGPPATA